MFESLELAPADPILGLNEAFQKDPNPAKINLSVGVFTNEQGATPVLQCVKIAEERLLRQETTKSYLSIAGLAQYDHLVQQLLLGPTHPLLRQRRVATIQTPGGTGALRVAADFIYQQFPQSTVWCSRPTWVNHPKVFEAAGLRVGSYPYLDAAARGLDFSAMLDHLRTLPAGDVVVLHGCCHNPSGIDLKADQWGQVARVMAQRKLLPLIDFAYQGFGTGLDDDALGVRSVVEVVDEVLLASSFSKNFGLYRERVGALCVVATDTARADAVLSHFKACVRTNYSNPPAHGAAVVETILQDPQLRSLWEEELAGMRERINGMRRLFVETMQQHAPDRDFSFLLPQRGMFSFSGLQPDEVDRLREEHAIYIVRSGRINVAAITTQNIHPLCRAIAAVISARRDG
jgi:aspartate aminotransferase/aromatic-amino-acid transaminase